MERPRGIDPVLIQLVALNICLSTASINCICKINTSQVSVSGHVCHMTSWLTKYCTTSPMPSLPYVWTKLWVATSSMGQESLTTVEACLFFNRSFSLSFHARLSSLTPLRWLYLLFWNFCSWNWTIWLEDGARKGSCWSPCRSCLFTGSWWWAAVVPQKCSDGCL